MSIFSADGRPTAATTGQRVITALVLIGLVVPIVAWPDGWLPATFLAACAVAAIVEWAALCGVRGYWRYGYVLGALLLLGLSAWLLAAGQVAWLLLPVAGWWLVGAPLWLYLRPGGRLPGALLGWLVVLPCWASLMFLHSRNVTLLAYLLVLIATMDSVAYFAGRRFGHRLLAPTLSPGKTRVGVYAALLAVPGLCLATGWWLELGGQQWLCLLWLSLLSGGWGIVGDLLESAMKRAAGVKNSGRLLAGHGGVLDRLDSLLAAAPIFVSGVLLCGL